MPRIADNVLVIALPHGPSGLSKATWTNDDLADMGWHDCRVHGVSVGGYEDGTLPPARLLLDLDYIVRWIEPARNGLPFSFLDRTRDARLRTGLEHHGPARTPARPHGDSRRPPA